MIEIQIEGNPKEFFLKIQERIRNLKKVFKDFSKVYLNNFIKPSFDNRGSSLGNSWAPLKRTTIRQKGNANVLVDTGRLKRAASTGSTLTIKTTENTLEIKQNNSVPYGRYHLQGTRHLPIRNYLYNDKNKGLPDRALEILVKMIEQSIGDLK
jgi:hypothetical protein